MADSPLVPLLPDLSPLRDNPAYRRLWVGNTGAGIGSQLAVVAIGLQVYALTSSTAAVGGVAAFAFVPLVVMGLYGGALSDRYDRRRVALVAQVVSWLTSVGCAALALAGNDTVWPLFVIGALWTGSFAVTSPACSAIYPRILRIDQLPAAPVLSLQQPGFLRYDARHPVP
jgi:MFS family permease